MGDVIHLRRSSKPMKLLIPPRWSFLVMALLILFVIIPSVATFLSFVKLW